MTAAQRQVPMSAVPVMRQALAKNAPAEMPPSARKSAAGSLRVMTNAKMPTENATLTASQKYRRLAGGSLGRGSPASIGHL